MSIKEKDLAQNLFNQKLIDIMQNFKLTASLPCFGHPQQTMEMVERVARQNLSGCEVYIVGDCCPHFQKLIDIGFMSRMKDIAYKNNNSLKFWNEPINHGKWGTYITNTVIGLAKGEYFIFLANDDIVSLNHFAN